jgi:hypothetical protein
LIGLVFFKQSVQTVRQHIHYSGILFIL